MEFKNEDPNFKHHSFWDFLKWQISKIKLFKPKKYWPKPQGSQAPQNQNNTIIPANKVENGAKITYIGHVTFLIQVDGLNILTDPVWSNRASPLSFAGPLRTQQPGVNIKNLPPIDIVLISHNHYDHMDIPTLKQLHKDHNPLIITPLGNDKTIKKHIPDAKIITLNWGQSHQEDKLNIYLETAQHWSARGLFDRNQALWGTFIIKTTLGDICFIGDSGYNPNIFKKIGQKHNNIILSLIPIGAYQPRWFMKSVHMDPLEALLTHLDLKSKISIGSHFDIFPLADDSYGEAAKELIEQRAKLQIKENEFIIPVVGSCYKC